MTKLTTLFAITVLSTSLGLAGCNPKRGAEKGDPASKPAEGEIKKEDKAPVAAPDKAATAPGTAPAGAVADKAEGAASPDKAAVPPATAGELPAECTAYKATIEKLASCDKLAAQVRDGLKQTFDQASASWASLPAAGKAGLATGCKAGTDAVLAAAKSTCGW